MMKCIEYKIMPRSSCRKHRISKDAAENIEANEVVLNVSLLQSHFGSPLHKSAKTLGICATVLKK